MLAGVIQDIGQMNALSLLSMADLGSHFTCSMSYVERIFWVLPEAQFLKFDKQSNGRIWGEDDYGRAEEEQPKCQADCA